eukprot:jgi/Botrbrau1/14682/Bobra.0108s0039.1
MQFIKHARTNECVSMTLWESFEMHNYVRERSIQLHSFRKCTIRSNYSGRFLEPRVIRRDWHIQGSLADVDGANASFFSSGPQDFGIAGTLDVTTPIELDMPEELEPLVEALQRSRLQMEEAIGIREALEAEAQAVAELSVNASDAFKAAKRAQDEATADAEATVIVKHKLTTELSELRRRLLDDTAGTQTGPFGTVDMTPDTGMERRKLEDMMQATSQRLIEIAKELQEKEAKLAVLEEKMQALEAAARQAEEVAAAAMSAAESAVRDEMEATAVAKGTESALRKALEELKELGLSYELPLDKKTLDLESRDKAKEDTLAGATLRSPGNISLDDVSDSKRKDIDVLEVEEDGPGMWQQALELSTPRLLGVGAVGLAVVALMVFRDNPMLKSLSARITAFAIEALRVEVAVAEVVRRLPLPHVPHGMEGFLQTIWLLLTSVIAVPLVCAIPGGSPVLGFLVGGALIGPHALGIIKDVEGVRHLAELGVVFLLFNIGLELSLERLRSMQKYVFGMGTAQVVATLGLVAYTVMSVSSGMVSGPAAIILGGGLALSSTAVAMQVLQDRGETGSRHGRAAFAVLLLQDLAVVVLLMLIPLLAPSEAGPSGFSKIAKALGVAAIKAVTCIVAIIAGGRLMLRPIYRRIADMGNPDVFAATTLLVVLGTSVLTQLAGLSLALGAFLAGLLLAETEFAIQVESDIAPYKGLLMGLFFMTVGMEISCGLFLAKLRLILGGILLLLVGKVGVMTAVGPIFGVSRISAARAGLLLAAGGEFAFVAFGEAQSVGILPATMVRELFLVVALSMALTPFLADLGQRLGKMLEKSDMKALQPSEGQVEELRDHVIIAGFGRVGQIIATLLAERLIPFVAIDVRVDRVQAGKAQDLPVYFGDAGSSAVLHSIGAARAACAVVTLDTPGANYRSVWALHKHYPHVKIYVRAHDVTHGINLERAGATAVVPETLEPSLQLASAVLAELNLPPDEVSEAVSNFRRTHLAELQALSENSGASLGYGFPIGGETTAKDTGVDNKDIPAVKQTLDESPVAV